MDQTILVTRRRHPWMAGTSPARFFHRHRQPVEVRSRAPSLRVERQMRCLLLAGLTGVVWALGPATLASETSPGMMTASSTGEVLVLAADSAPGTGQVGSLRAEIAHENGFRVYRVEFRGSTYETRRALHGQRRPVAFVPDEARFADVLPELRVVLDTPEALEAVVAAVGAVGGKAYPPGWALILLPRDVNPAEVARALRSHPSVASVEVQLKRPRFRPMQAASGDAAPLQTDDPAYKDDLAADLFVEILGLAEEDDGAAATPHPDLFIVVGSYENRGAVASSQATATWALNTDADFRVANALQGEVVVPPLSPGDSVEIPVQIAIGELPDTSEGLSYYARIEVGATPEEPARNRDNNTAYFGFTLGSSGGVSPFATRCDQISPRGDVGSSNPDPLRDEQWNLDNSGQAAFARYGGRPGEDLNMAGVMADATAPTGAGVRVAVVDTGLEICHPDLAANVEAGKSWNFLAPHQLPGSQRHDPFLTYTLGDHGTSVAGITAAAADNGIGGRGVAPDAELRGYNFLVAQGNPWSYYDSLGLSRTNPDSTGVDVFNMSFGSTRASNASQATVDLFKHGVENLRDGLGAVYVKASGNGFHHCHSVRLPVHNDIGCVAANADSSSSLPYLVVVGGLNADGLRASYASAGANLWVSAPAGEYGVDSPANITTDQIGRDRGYTVRTPVGLALYSGLNPNGNYVSTFNGTSAAAPNATGAVALLLEARPDLSWRDVKHILARTARQVDPNIVSVERLLANGYYELRMPWTANGAGYVFHNWYGFGAIDVDAALNHAAAHRSDSLGEYWETLPYRRDALSLSIADANRNGATDRLTINDLGSEARVESVTATVRIDHPFPHDLAIELRSPSGTTSVLNPAFNEVLAARRGYLQWDLLSNAFYGEDPTGDWELVVVDAATRDEGRLLGWDLRFGLGAHAAGMHPVSGTDDHGNIRRAATDVGNRQSVAGVLELAGDIDYFRIDVASWTTLVLNTVGTTPTIVVLEDENGNVLASDRGDGRDANFRIAYQLPPGTYYLRVEGRDTDTVGAYSVTFEQDPAGPVQARAYAIAPVTAADQSRVRIRCESGGRCGVALDCADAAGAPISFALRFLEARETLEFGANYILARSGLSGWTRRLACLVRSRERVSAQVWTQSGGNVLVNNTAILDAEFDGSAYIARVYSLPAPNSPSGNIVNVRIRCESSQDCGNVRMQCFDDSGRQIGLSGPVRNRDHGIVNGRIPPWAVARLQADHIADTISVGTWPDLRMSCAVESLRPISVQLLTRSGGPGGPLVNNTALSLGR